MTTTNTASSFADQAAQGAENAIRNTQRAADGALDRLSDGVAGVRAQVAPQIDRVTGEAEDLARRGLKAVRERSEQLRTQALRTWDGTIDYIKDEPVKAVLIAAAAGAALVAIISVLNRSNGARH